MGKFIRDYQVGKTFSKEEKTFKPNRKKVKKFKDPEKREKKQSKKIKRWHMDWTIFV